MRYALLVTPMTSILAHWSVASSWSRAASSATDPSHLLASRRAALTPPELNRHNKRIGSVASLLKKIGREKMPFLSRGGREMPVVTDVARQLRGGFPRRKDERERLKREE
jgi:hypothetical protein